MVLLIKQQVLVSILMVLLLRQIEGAQHYNGGAVYATSGADLIYVVLLMIQVSGAQYESTGAKRETSGADFNMYGAIDDIA